MGRRRFAVCGVSDRAINMFVLPVLGKGEESGIEDLSALTEIVAILDVDSGRMDRFKEQVGLAIPSYQPDEFDRMVAEQRPDAVIVAGPDVTHARYTIAALQQDLDVIVEKPLTAFAEQAREVLIAEQASAGSVTVGHNTRYGTSLRRMRNMIRDGAIGRVVAIDLIWGVDTYHGASYFWRWNRVRANSGGLSVHKACHHLDMVNWLVADVPAHVYSLGGRNFYGPTSPHRPVAPDGGQLSVAAERLSSPYYQRWKGAALPPEQDHFIGPWRALGYPVQYPPGTDRYLFDDEIDIEDTYSTVVRYAGGASMSYTLCFSMPWEGFKLGITGTHGRIETDQISFRGTDHVESEVVTYLPLFGPSERIEVAAETGGHGGTDPRIRRDLLLGASEVSINDGLKASSVQGAIAVATGEAMWRSHQEQAVISVAELLGLESLPAWNDPLSSLKFRSTECMTGQHSGGVGRS